MLFRSLPQATRGADLAPQHTGATADTNEIAPARGASAPTSLVVPTSTPPASVAPSSSLMPDGRSIHAVTVAPPPKPTPAPGDRTNTTTPTRPPTATDPTIPGALVPALQGPTSTVAAQAQPLAPSVQPTAASVSAVPTPPSAPTPTTPVSTLQGPGLTAAAATSTSNPRSEEHTSELPSLMRISYAVLC